MASPIQINVGANAQGVFDEIIRQARRAQEIISRNPPEIKVKNIGGFKTLIADMDKFDKSVSRMSSVVLTFGQTAAYIFGFERAMASLVTTTISVEKQLTKIKVLLDSTSDEFGSFSKELFNVAKQTSQSFATATAAAEEFARQGLPIEETLKRTHDALILVNTSGISVGEAIKTLTVSMAAFKKEIGDTTKVANILNNVDAAFAVSTKDLSDGLQRAGATAQTVGVSFNQLIALITSLQQTTQRGGNIIGNSLKSLFTRAERAKNLDIFEGLGIRTTDAEGNIRNIVDVLKEYADAENRLGTVQKQRNREQLAGIFQINNLSSLLNDLNSTYSVYDQALSKANKTTDEAIQRNDTLNKTLSGLLSQTGTGLTQFASNLGNKGIAPGLRDVLGFANKALDGLNQGITGGGNGAGEQFGRILIGGLGNFISGPGLVLFLGIAQRIGRLVAKGVVDQLKGAFDLTKSSEAQLNLQQQINAVMSSQDASIQKVLASAKSRAEYEELILKIIQEQNNALASGNTYGAGLASRAIKGGFNAVGNKGFQLSAAGGFIPSMVAEQGAINRGIGGASPSARPVLIPNFSFGGGAKGDIVANTDEYLVPNYANGGSAIFNKNMVRSFGLPRGARKIAASGYIPNFDPIGMGSKASFFDLGNGWGFKQFRKSDSASRELLAEEFLLSTYLGKRLGGNVRVPAVGGTLKESLENNGILKRNLFSVGANPSDTFGQLVPTALRPKFYDDVGHLASSHTEKHGIQLNPGEFVGGNFFFSKNFGNAFSSKKVLSQYNKLLKNEGTGKSFLENVLIGSGGKLFISDLDNHLGENPDVGMKISKVASRYLAGGYIPNLAKSSLSDALHREVVALSKKGYSKEEIQKSLRVQSSARLKNPLNPMGLGVFNTLQGQNNIDKALSDHVGENIWTAGKVPNFATIPPFSPLDPYGSIYRPISNLSGNPLQTTRHLGAADTSQLIASINSVQKVINELAGLAKFSGEAKSQLGQFSSALRGLEKEVLSRKDKQAKAFASGKDISEETKSEKQRIANIILEKQREQQLQQVKIQENLVKLENERFLSAEKEVKSQKRKETVSKGLFGASLTLPFLQSSIAELGGLKPGSKAAQQNEDFFSGASVGTSAAFLTSNPYAQIGLVAGGLAIGSLRAANSGRNASKNFFEADQHLQSAQDKQTFFSRNAGEFASAFSLREDLLKNSDAKPFEIKSANENLANIISKFGGVTSSNLSTLSFGVSDSDKRKNDVKKILENLDEENSRNVSSTSVEKLIKDKQESLGRSYGVFGRKNIEALTGDEKQKLTDSIFNSIDTSKVNKKSLEGFAFGGDSLFTKLSEAIPQLTSLDGDLTVVTKSLRAEVEKEVAIKILNKKSTEELSDAVTKLNISQQTAKQNLKRLGEDVSFFSKVSGAITNIQNRGTIDLAKESLNSPFATSQQKFFGGLQISKSELQANIQDQINSVKEGSLTSLISKADSTLGGKDGGKAIDLALRLVKGELSGGGSSTQALLDAIKGLYPLLSNQKDKDELNKAVDQLKEIKIISDAQLAQLDKLASLQLKNNVKTTALNFSDILSQGDNGPLGSLRKAISTSLILSQKSKAEVDFNNKNSQGQATDFQLNHPLVNTIASAQFNRAKTKIDEFSANKAIGEQDLIDAQRLSASFGTPEYNKIDQEIKNRRNKDKQSLLPSINTVLTGDIIARRNGEIGANFQGISDIAGENIPKSVSKINDILNSNNKDAIKSQLPNIISELQAAGQTRSVNLGGESGKRLSAGVSGIISSANSVLTDLSSSNFGTIADARAGKIVGETDDRQLQALNKIDKSTSDLLAPISAISPSIDAFKADILSRMDSAAKVASASSAVSQKQRELVDAKQESEAFNNSSIDAKKRRGVLDSIDSNISTIQSIRNNPDDGRPNFGIASERRLGYVKDRILKGLPIELPGETKTEDILNKDFNGISHINIDETLRQARDLRQLPKSFYGNNGLISSSDELDTRNRLKYKATEIASSLPSLERNLKDASDKQNSALGTFTEPAKTTSNIQTPLQVTQNVAVNIASSLGGIGAAINPDEIKKLIEDYLSAKLASENKAKGEKPPINIK